jgi:hypothetical protein
MVDAQMMCQFGPRKKKVSTLSFFIDSSFFVVVEIGSTSNQSKLNSHPPHLHHAPLFDFFLLQFTPGRDPQAGCLAPRRSMLEADR